MAPLQHHPLRQTGPQVGRYPEGPANLPKTVRPPCPEDTLQLSRAWANRDSCFTTRTMNRPAPKQSTRGLVLTSGYQEHDAENPSFKYHEDHLKTLLRLTANSGYSTSGIRLVQSAPIYDLGSDDAVFDWVLHSIYPVGNSKPESGDANYIHKHSNI